MPFIVSSGGIELELPKRNKPGLWGDIKRGTGQIIGSAGSTLQDLGADHFGRAVEGYGDEMVDANASEINSMRDVIDKPGTTVREAVGEVVPQLGLSLGTGLGGRAIGGYLGGALGSLAGPAGTAAGAGIGQWVGGMAGAALPTYMQEYGGIRKEQRDQGIEGKTRATMAAVPATALELIGGPERIISKIASKGAKSVAKDVTKDGFWKYAAKEGAKSAVVEGPLTEVPQTVLERWGAFKDLTGDEAYDEYGVAGIKGAIGGFAAGSAMSPLTRRRQINDPTRESDLLRGDTQPGQQLGLFQDQEDFQVGPHSRIDATNPDNSQAIAELDDRIFRARMFMQQAAQQGNTAEFYQLQDVANRLQAARDQLGRPVDSAGDADTATPDMFAASTTQLPQGVGTPAAPQVEQPQAKAGPLDALPPEVVAAAEANGLSLLNAKGKLYNAKRTEAWTKAVELRQAGAIDDAMLKQTAEILGKNRYGEASAALAQADADFAAKQRGAANGSQGGVEQPAAPGVVGGGAVTGGSVAPDGPDAAVAGERGGSPGPAGVGTPGAAAPVLGTADVQPPAAVAESHPLDLTPEAQEWEEFKRPEAGKFSEMPAALKDAWKQAVALRDRGERINLTEIADQIYDELKADEAPSTAMDDLEKALGKRDLGVLMDRAQGMSEEDVAAKHKMSRANVQVIAGETGRAKRLKRLEAAAKKHGWTPEYIASLKERLIPKTPLETGAPAELGMSSMFNIGALSDQEAVEHGVLDAENGDTTIDSAGSSKSAVEGFTKFDNALLEVVQALNDLKNKPGATLEEIAAAQQRVNELTAELANIEKKRVAAAEEARTNGKNKKTTTENSEQSADADMASEEDARPDARPDEQPEPQKPVPVVTKKKRRIPVKPEATAEQAPQEPDYKTDRERAGEAWNTHTEGMEGVPKFEDLPKGVQARWTDYGASSWGVGDVATELKRMQSEGFSFGEEGAAGTKYSRAGKESNTTGNTSAGVESEIDRWFPGRKKNPAYEQHITVYQSEKQAAEATGKTAREVRNARGFVDPSDPRRIHLIADNIKPGETLAVVLHELGVHIGLWRALGANFKLLVAQVRSWAKSPKGSLERRVYEAAMARVASARMSDSLSVNEAQEELVAYAAEEAVSMGVRPALDSSSRLSSFLARLHAVVGRAFKSFFGTTQVPSLSPKELVSFAYGAAQDRLETNLPEVGAAGYNTAGQIASYYAKTNEDDLHSNVKVTDRGPGLEVVYWGDESSYGPHKSITTMGSEEIHDPDFEGRQFVVYLFSKESLALAKESGDEIDAPLQTVALRELQPGLWDIIEWGPHDQSRLFRLLRQHGEASLTDTGWSRLEGIPRTETKEFLTEVRRRLTRFLGGQVPAVEWRRATGVHEGKDNAPTRRLPPKKVKSKYSRVAPTASAKLPGEIRPFVESATEYLRNAGGKALDLFTFTDDVLRRAAAAGLASATRLGDLYRARAALTRQVESKVRAIERLYGEIAPKHERGKGERSANRLLYDITREGKWAFKPEWLADGKVTVDAATAARFDAMSPAAQAWIKSVLKHGDEMMRTKRKHLIEAVDSEYDARIKTFEDAGNTAKASELRTDKKNQLARFERAFSANETAPYAPMRRFGNYVVVAKSQQYLDAQAAGDTKTMEKLESDPDHYQVSFVDSMWKAQKMRDELRQEGSYAQVTHREREKSRNDLYGGMLAAYNKLRTDIEAAKGNANDKAERAALDAAHEMVTDMYLQSLAETSARKSELRRKGISGDLDMLQSFAAQGRADAHFVAASKYNTQMLRAVNDMRQESKKAGGDMRASQLFNEIVARHEQSMKFNDSNLAARVNATTSIWMLATRPAYYLQNLTQPFMMSVPVMSERHAYAAAWGHILRAYKEIGPLIRGAKDGSPIDFAKVPPDVRDAIATLVDRGRLDISLESELGSTRLEGSNAASKAANIVTTTMRTLNQKVEAINRVTTAMAAYRLELAKTGDKAMALAYAEEIVAGTHGDYSSVNAPRAFNTTGGKIALQFRKFQLVQLTMMGKLLQTSLQGATPGERAAAFQAFSFLLGHTAVMAGIAGLPGFAAIAFALKQLAKAFGDDDEPYDLENELTKAFGNDDVARMLMRGAPTLANMNVSEMVGMGNALSVLPYTDTDFTREGFNAAATGVLLGATGGLMAKEMDAIGLMLKGDYYRGLQLSLPSGLGNVIKAWRESTEGVTRRNGDVLVSPEEVTLWETTQKALSFNPESSARRQFNADIQHETEQAFKDRGDKVKNQYTRARKEGDTDKIAELREQWQKLQDSRDAAGFKRQPLSTLLQAPAKQAERERRTVGGIQYNKFNRRFVMEQAGEQ